MLVLIVCVIVIRILSARIERSSGKMPRGSRISGNSERFSRARRVRRFGDYVKRGVTIFGDLVFVVVVVTAPFCCRSFLLVFSS